MQTRHYKYVVPHLITDIIQCSYGVRDLDENRLINILYNPNNAVKVESTFPEQRSDGKWQIHKYNNSFIWLVELDNLFHILITKLVEKNTINAWCLDYHNNILDQETLKSFLIDKQNDI